MWTLAKAHYWPLDGLPAASDRAPALGSALLPSFPHRHKTTAVAPDLTPTLCPHPQEETPLAWTVQRKSWRHVDGKTEGRVPTPEPILVPPGIPILHLCVPDARHRHDAQGEAR